MTRHLSLAFLLSLLLALPVQASIRRDTSKLDILSADQTLVQSSYEFRNFSGFSGRPGVAAGIRMNNFIEEWCYFGLDEMLGGYLNQGNLTSPFLSLAASAGITGGYGPMTWDFSLAAGPGFSLDALSGSSRSNPLLIVGGPDLAIGVNIGAGFRLVTSYGYLFLSNSSDTYRPLTVAPFWGVRLENKQLNLRLPST